MKRTLSILCAAALAAGAAFAGGSADKGIKTYSGEGKGKHGPVVVELSVKDGKIVGTKVVAHKENKILAEPVFTKIGALVVETNNVNVDAVSGSTATSEAYVAAVQDAAKKAGLSLSGEKIAVKPLREKEVSQAYDVVVIGAGGAGFCAAIEAKLAGASVVILEKMPTVGGNTLLSGGQLNVPGNWVQEKLGIQDDVEKYIADTLKGGDGKGDPAVVRYMAEHALESAVWLRDYVGMKFYENELFQFGGHSVKRALIPVGHTGYEMVSKLKAKADELGIPVKLETKAEALTVKDGKVVAVQASNAAGQALSFSAKKGVVIAAGGFGANVEMRSKFVPELDASYMTTDSAGTTGDGIVMAEEIGAVATNMASIQTYPICNPVSGIISLVADSRFDGAMLVNQEGSRFVEELARRDVMSRAILAQTGRYCYQLWDTNVANITKTHEIHAEEYESLVADKVLFKTDTLAQAAEAVGIPAAALEATVARWNGFAAAGKDEDFKYRAKMPVMDKGPWYIMKAVPSVHHTMGGLVVDADTRVLDASGKAIGGLYAAGEVTGVIHGTNRLGGNAVTDITVFGRAAGKMAAAGK